MQISRTEFNRFKAVPHHPALRFGQAWFNYFTLQKHTPASDAERVMLDRIYNERDPSKAESLILANFTDPTN